MISQGFERGLNPLVIKSTAQSIWHIGLGPIFYYWPDKRKNLLLSGVKSTIRWWEDAKAVPLINNQCETIFH